MKRNRALLVTWLGALGLAAAAWPAGQKQPSAAPARKSGTIVAQVASGKKIYDSNCEICHFSTSTAKKIGPGLKGFSARGRYADGTRVNDENLRRLMEQGGKNMPGFRDRLKPDQIRDVLAYLKTL